jgi:hypothetical protein
MSERNDKPLLRPGVLHFVGSFFGLDEEFLLSNPALYNLSPKRIAKGAKDFYDTIAYQPGNNKQGWEILHSALGLGLDQLYPKRAETPEKYVTRVWAYIMRQMGIPMSLKVIDKEKKNWVFQVTPSHYEMIQTSMREAFTRMNESPIHSRNPSTIEPKGKTECLIDDDDLFFLQRELGLYIGDCLNKNERLLFLTAHEKAAEHALTFLRRNGASSGKILGCCDSVGKKKGFGWNPNKLHTAQILLLGVDFVPLRYHPGRFDRVIIWNLPSILHSLHVSNPVPNFFELARKEENGKFPPTYYKRLWQAADLFHLTRELVQNARDVWVTGVKKDSKEIKFLERIRGNVTYLN